MFGCKRRKEQLHELNEQRQLLEQEKNELLKLKEIMEGNYPKIDITYVYVFEEQNINYLVMYRADKIKGRLLNGKGPIADGYDSKLIDIFTNKVIYHKCSKNLITRTEKVFEDSEYKKFHYANLIPICEKEPNLLAYIDKQVPLYVLQRVYYKLNNVELSSPIFKNISEVRTLKK